MVKLLPHQVPDFPDDAVAWEEWLRWLIMVMDEKDTSLPFVVGVYSYALKNDGGITPKQAEVVDSVIDRIHEAWCADELECCQIDLESMNVGGHA